LGGGLVIGVANRNIQKDKQFLKNKKNNG
jgi:hypothetical protein